MNHRLLAIACLAMIPMVAFAQLPTPTYGWNLGNTLEPPSGEGTWGPAATQTLINAVADSGFNTIRLPVAWDSHANPSTHVIDPAWLARVKQVVDWCYARNLTVVVNCHWDGGWLENHIGTTVDPTINAKMQSYWTQIATTFAGYDDHLLFAGANEPNCDTAAQWTTLRSYYNTFISAVRATGGNNPHRWLVVQGPNTNIDLSDQLVTSLPDDSTPGRLVFEIHHYPYRWSLMGEDAWWGKMFYFWGQGYHSPTMLDRNSTAEEEASVDEQFQKMATKFVAKGVPVIIGEWGAIKRTGYPDLTGVELVRHLASRTYYSKYVTDKANALGLKPFWWDAGGTGNNTMWLFDRSTATVIDPDNVRALTGGPALPPSGSPRSVAIPAPADFDRDGQSDLIWQNTVTGERSFWLMNQTTLKRGVSLGMFAPDWTIVGSGDFNADGKADLLWQNTITGERSIWLMDGTSLTMGVDLGIYSTDIMIVGSGDFNSDGKTDIVWQNIATGERGVWLMNGTTKTGDASMGIVPTAWSIAGTGDFNANGKMDLVWQNAATGERTIWLMDGTTKTAEISLGTVAKQFQIVGTGDYNNDGKTDLVWTDTETGERSIWLMNGSAHTSTVVFSLVSVEWFVGRPIFLTAQTAHADFNADGQTDIISQNTATGERTITLMNGSTVVSVVSLGTTSTDWVISGTGDFNHDDKPDIVWSNTLTGERTVWLMDGTTKLSNVPLPTVPPEWRISAIGDFNYDGKPDLVWSSTTTGERAVWLMNGTVFGSGISLGTVPPNWSIGTTADLNGDGKTDLVWQNTATGESSVWLMNGGSFAAGVALDTLPTPWVITGKGDFNADGKADLLLQNTATGERAVRIMNRTSYQSTVSLGVTSTTVAVGN